MYVTGDHAFNFEARVGADASDVVGDAGTTSLTLNTLQLEVSLRTRRCLWLWGYSPTTRWIVGEVPEPVAQDGSVEVLGVQLAPGISIRIPGSSIREELDARSGWFGVFAGTKAEGQPVRIATDTVVFVADGALSAVLVRPANWREIKTQQIGRS